MSDAVLKEIENLIQEKEIPTYPRLIETDIENFNKKYGVELPAEYTMFLTTVGDGWKKVYNQQFSSVSMNLLSESFRRPEWLKKVFPFSEAWLWEDNEDEAVFPREPDESDRNTTSGSTLYETLQPMDI